MREENKQAMGCLFWLIIGVMAIALYASFMLPCYTAESIAETPGYCLMFR